MSSFVITILGLIGWCEVQNRYVKGAQLSSWHSNQCQLMGSYFMPVPVLGSGRQGSLSPCLKGHALDRIISFRVI